MKQIEYYTNKELIEEFKASQIELAEILEVAETSNLLADWENYWELAIELNETLIPIIKDRNINIED